MRSEKLRFHTLRTSDEDRSVMRSQAQWASERPPKCDTELHEAGEGQEGVPAERSSMYQAQKPERSWCV